MSSPHKDRIDALKPRLEQALPGADVRIEASPVRPEGSWFVDVRHANFPHGLYIEFRPYLGFGLSYKPVPAYGTPPDEMVADEDTLLSRIVELATNMPPTE